MEIKSYRCKSCGAPLEFSSGSSPIRCAYCKTEHARLVIEEMEASAKAREAGEHAERIRQLKEKLSSMDKAMGMIAAIERSGDFSRYNENVRKAVREAYGQGGLDILDANIEKIKAVRGIPVAATVTIAVVAIFLWVATPILALLLSFIALLIVPGRISGKKKYWVAIKRELDQIRAPAESMLKELRARLLSNKMDEIKEEILDGTKCPACGGKVHEVYFRPGVGPRYNYCPTCDMSVVDKLYSKGMDSGLCPACGTETRTAFLADGGYGAYCPACKMGVKEIVMKNLYT